MRSAAVVAAILAQASSFAPFDVSSMLVAPPTPILDISRGTLHGEPSRLAWSPDGSTLYLQSRDGVGPAARLRHFAVALTSPRLRPLDVEPDWALDYWRSKVTEGAPGMPWLKIDVILDQDRRRIAPLAGGFASAGSATGTDAAATITTSYVILSFLGVEVGRWLREEPRSGATFGWGPSGSGAMAFVDGQGRLTLLDKERRQQGVVRAESVSYPAWSPDGGYIAYLEKTGRSKWRIASVALLRTDARLQ